MIPLFVAACVAWASPQTGADWLAAVDDAAGAGVDARVEVVLSVERLGADSAERAFTLFQKGADRRMVRMERPANVAGTSLLRQADGSLAIYLPAYGRVRVVKSARRQERLLDSDLTLDDLGQVSWSSRYGVSIAGSTDDAVTLRLVPHDGTGGHVMLSVRSADQQVLRAVYFSDAGEVERKVELGDFRPVGARLVPHRIDASEPGRERRTTARIVSVDLSTPVDAAWFTVDGMKECADNPESSCN